MQKIVFLLLFVFSGTASFSQQQYFVYLQADDHQTFYARINTLVYSSTDNGYLIIPKLADSIYTVTIGFAKSAFPEQNFSVAINKKDKGFQLKNFGEKGWALINLQNMSVIISTSLPSKVVSEFSGQKKTDAFSEMLANVVNDSSILYTSVKAKLSEAAQQKKSPVKNASEEKTEQVKDSTASSVAVLSPTNKDTLKSPDSYSTPGNVLSKNTSTDIPLKTEIVNPVSTTPDNGKTIDSGLAQKVITERPFITRIEEKKADGFYQATYLEQFNLSTDTIKISIPLAEGNVMNTPALTPVTEKNEPGVDQKNSGGLSSPSHPVVTDTAVSVKSMIQITNSDCKSLASDYDVDKLRVKLINDKTIDDKLATAKKYFKNKCLSVKQVKALTELFPSDETKYRFFDVSYPFISDTNNFYTLEELIENNYYKNRFKAMIQK